jgi:3-deoxy-7-phosphoheptulonate synthase
MIVVLEHGIRARDKSHLVSFLKNKGFKIREIQGEEETILGAVGLVPIDFREVELLPGVARVIPITKPYKLASRELKKEDTCISVGSINIGGPRIVVMAGPCAVESRQQILEIAHLVKESGAAVLRGGGFKPRTSPYAFQGLGEEGLNYLKEAGEETGLPTISEIVSPEHVEIFKDTVDILQIGARNMQNFELLKRVGALKKAVMLKRGPAATIQELLMSAEYLLAHGTDQVILCERGIKTFETYTRNTLDISAIPVVKKLSHLPIFVDPSHGTGIREKVLPMALAAIAAGSDGIIVEVHTDPDKALSDGPQTLYPSQFEKLMRDIEALAPVLGKEVAKTPERLAHFTTPGIAAPEKREQLLVSFQGERGAFSEIALYRTFPEGAKPEALKEFKDVFESVLQAKTDFGIVPVENTLTGSIHQNYDLLLQYPDLKIVGEKKIRIVHNLIGLPPAKLGDIKRVYSHPQGLSQCSRFLDLHPQWEKISYYDTAGSVAFVAREGKKHYASIASAEAARVHRMKILKENIETNTQNYTRFVIIARDEAKDNPDPDKASLVFSTANESGSLYRALKILADWDINMSRLESRPIPGKPWEEMFYVDVDIPETGSNFTEALDVLKKETEHLRVLGLYKSAR